MATGSDLVRQARRFLGVPFAAGGRNCWGLDCGGLLVRVTQNLGLTDFDVPNYDLVTASACVAQYLEPFCDRIDLGAPFSIYQGEGLKPGDFLVFSLAKGAQHAAIATGEGTVIHAWDSPSVRAVVEHPLDSWWLGRLLSVWRFRGLEDG